MNLELEVGCSDVPEVGGEQSFLVGCGWVRDVCCLEEFLESVAK